MTNDDDAVDLTARREPAWRWLSEAARSLVWRQVDWSGLRSTPRLLAALLVADLLVAIAAGRLDITGPTIFFWQALGEGWLWSAVVAWGCWNLLRRRVDVVDASREPADAASLFTLLLAQDLVLNLVALCVWLPLRRAGMVSASKAYESGHLVGAGLSIWYAIAQARLAWECLPSVNERSRMRFAGLLMMAFAASAYLLPVTYWYPAPAEADAVGPPELHLSQQVFEAQQQLLARQLDAVAPARPGAVDLYAITFAPYADQDVFMRESQVVADTMDSRFGARGRTLQLVNNLTTLDRFAWATPLNLKRSIDRVAQRMDRDKDILFIHLTSHGGSNGHLAAEFFPLTVDQLTPRMLRTWLDEAGVKNRVISISACFSGSWVAPLAGADTLVMTAADADHTSYGCGSKSTLTFFGQAMYAEQLRHTWSFEDAHAASRTLIDQREKEAGKSDGYSNPQISVGARIRGPLKALEARLAASAAR